MPTNLPAEARAKWAKYLEARTTEEKLEALQEFLSAIPKHKGTENLVSWVRKKIAELRRELEAKKTRKSGGGPSFFIRKEGAAQVVIIGMTQVGKSSLLSKLTNAKPKISTVPFTTKFPVPGMLPYEDIKFQLVEAPAFVEGMSKGAVWWGSRTLGLARNSDALMLVVDLSTDPLRQLRVLATELRNAGILLKKPEGSVEIERGRGVNGVRVIQYGEIVGATVDEVRRLLESYRIYNATVRIYGRVSLDDIERAIFERVVYKPSLIVLNKADLVAEERIRRVEDIVRKALPEVPVVVASALTGEGLEKIAPTIFKVTGVIRVYTKEPNAKGPSPEPLIFKHSVTVEDVIREIRKEYLKYFKYAKIWGPSAKYPGERVGLTHQLKDGDVIEIRTTVRAL